MLDEGKCRLPAGFPDHPHRGMENVAYIKSGSVLYEDSLGNSGELSAGDM